MARIPLPSPYVGHGNGRDGSRTDGEDICSRRHSDWFEHQILWRRLLDSYEGGQRYREAVYGPDRRGWPLRNLLRHRREYPDPSLGTTVDAGAVEYVEGPMLSVPGAGRVGADAGATALDDDYEMRRARTPVPGWVGEACGIHLGKIYDQEVNRQGPKDLTAWWEDADGRGTPIDDYMRETVAPLLLVLGCLDVCLDHPPAPEGEEVLTRADELRLGLDRCVASYILPENMVWWRLDRAGRYVECLVREYVDPADRNDRNKDGNPIDPEGDDLVSREWREDYLRWRHWTTKGWTLYDCDGDEVLDSGKHKYGRVPIVRLIDIPKHRTPNIGQSRYEEVAELQRQYYNVDSELTLSNTLQAHPVLSGPEEWCRPDDTVPMGPGNILPMKRSADGHYQNWEFVSPPKDPAESLSKKLRELEDRKDRAACLAKPAGAVAGSTTAQSGVSKQLDAVTGHKMLSSIAKSLRKAERMLAEAALMVLRGAEPDPEVRKNVYIEYPSKFELFSADELLDGGVKLQLLTGQVGDLPRIEGEIVRQVARRLNPGLKDEEYAAMDDEIEAFVEKKAAIREQMREQAPDAFDGQDQGDNSPTETPPGDRSA